ncbi:MAG: ferredoxin [Spirochaetales bacterium]|nr:ferredoxin [Spirochaetales bacterium]
MLVKIDENLCVGCGLCEENIPKLFYMKNQLANVYRETVEPEEAQSVKETAQDCPAEAILLTEDTH